MLNIMESNKTVLKNTILKVNVKFSLKLFLQSVGYFGVYGLLDIYLYNAIQLKSATIQSSKTV